MEEVYTNISDNDQLFDFLFSEDDISWKTMIYELVRSEQMNPWDIDLNQLSKKFLQKLKELKEMNFRISGKVILAASILLKLKSEKLIATESEIRKAIREGMDPQEAYIKFSVF